MNNSLESQCQTLVELYFLQYTTIRYATQIKY